MVKNKSISPRVALTLGMLGVAAGVFLIFSENYVVGISGSIASAAIVIKGYADSKKTK